MSDISYYEKIPNDSFPIRIRECRNISYTFSAHWHEHLELHFIISGSGRIKLGEKIIEVRERACVVSNSNEMHEGIDGNVTYIYIIIPPEFLGDNHVIFESLFYDEKIWKYVDEIYRLHNEFSSVNALGIKAQTYLLLKHLIEDHSIESLDDAIYQKRLKKLSAINSVIKYINDNYSETMSTKTLADMIHISEGHFCSVFKSATGVSTNEYIMNVRIKKAKRLLQYSSMNITEISNACGFNDPNYFTRAFKKHLNKTPKQYRSEVKQNENDYARE